MTRKAFVIAVCFGQYGPYHHARVRAFQRFAHLIPYVIDASSRSCPSIQVLPVQICSMTTTYLWKGASRPCSNLTTLCQGIEENVNPISVFLRAWAFFLTNRVKVAFVPSYYPIRCFALLAAAKASGIRVVMMNESHGGTSVRNQGLRFLLKRFLISCFDSALVGGQPQKRYFIEMGIHSSKIFTGYDAIDNQFHKTNTDSIRRLYTANQFGLPRNYILSLGRMVNKKIFSV
jgi:1,2-diacylglycerol 3-alpha-glucosyltransferase